MQLLLQRHASVGSRSAQAARAKAHVRRKRQHKERARRVLFGRGAVPPEPFSASRLPFNRAAVQRLAHHRS